MKYKIKVIYDTGDSFRNEDGVEDYLEGSWENLDVVKENLKRIEEHYKFVKNESIGFFYKRKELEKNARSASWYCEKYPRVALLLKLDNGTNYQVSAFWAGYFESLSSLKVELDLPEIDSFSVYF